MKIIKTLSLFSVLSLFPAIGMDLQETLTERRLVHSVYEIFPPEGKRSCYLVGTQHVNADVTDALVVFVTKNCFKISFEMIHNSSLSDSGADFFAQVYLQYHENKSRGISFFTSEFRPECIGSAILLLKEEFEHISSYELNRGCSLQVACKKYKKTKEKSLQMAQEESKNIVNKKRMVEESGVHDHEAVLQWAKVDSLLDLRSKPGFSNETYVNLSDHDKSVVDLCRQFNFDDPLTQRYVEIKDLQCQSEHDIKKLEEDMDEHDRVAADAFLFQLGQEDNNWESRLAEQNRFFNQEVLPFINPFDLIALEFYIECDKSLVKLYSRLTSQGAGVEDNLTRKVSKVTPAISFGELETHYTRFMGMRKLVELYTPVLNGYEAWGEILAQFKSLMNSNESDVNGEDFINDIFGTSQDPIRVLPPVLAQVLRGTLTEERENFWLRPILDSMKDSSLEKGELFAVGNEHILSLVTKLKEKGCVVVLHDLQ